MEQLQEILKTFQIDQWGIAMLDKLPLLPVRSKSRIPQEACQVIIILFGYYIGDYPDRNLSRYAIADDYHQILLPKLTEIAAQLEGAYPGEQFIPFIDASPIPEVRAASLAGLGDIGWNGQLLNPVYGSYCFIGEIVTTKAFPLPERPPVPPVCTRCGACICACPTGALTVCGFTKTLCRSYITQKKGILTPWESDQIQKGKLVWGCDCCTDSCPVNRHVQRSNVPEFYKNPVSIFTVEKIEELCKIKAYGWRGAELLRRNLSLIKNVQNDTFDC